MNIQEVQSTIPPQWCPGCGNFGILMAMKQALVDLNLPTHEVVLVSGIGCSGKTPHYLKTYGFESIHGRSLPPASAINLVNPNLKVIVNGGDGDGYGIGLNHFVQAMRRNFNLTYLVHDNQIYGLTKGQYSPTSAKHTISKTSPAPDGSIEEPINPLRVALDSGATFIARGFAGDVKQLTEIIKQAIQHQGFSLIDILQPCVTFNKVNTYGWYQQRVKPIVQTPATKSEAWELAGKWGDEIPTGIFWQEQKPDYRSELSHAQGKTLIREKFDDIDISKILEKMM